MDINFTINLFWTIFFIILIGGIGYDIYMIKILELDDPFGAIWFFIINTFLIVVLLMMLAGKYLF